MRILTNSWACFSHFSRFWRFYAVLEPLESASNLLQKRYRICFKNGTEFASKTAFLNHDFESRFYSCKTVVLKPPCFQGDFRIWFYNCKITAVSSAGLARWRMIFPVCEICIRYRILRRSTWEKVTLYRESDIVPGNWHCTGKSVREIEKATLYREMTVREIGKKHTPMRACRIDISSSTEDRAFGKGIDISSSTDR